MRRQSVSFDRAAGYYDATRAQPDRAHRIARCGASQYGGRYPAPLWADLVTWLARQA